MRKIIFIRKRLQQKIAGMLQQKFEGVSYKAKLIIMTLFFLTGGSYCAYTIFKSVLKEGALSLTITSVKKPAYVFPLNEDVKDKDLFSEKEYQNLQGIKYYMDSLKKSKNGKRLYDSILVKNPSLMENIQVIERIYQKQTKK